MKAIAELLDKMLEFEGTRNTLAKGYGPYHITYQRWESLNNVNKRIPEFRLMAFAESSESFIIAWWKVNKHEALQNMDIKELLTNWYGVNIANELWWTNAIKQMG